MYGASEEAIPPQVIEDALERVLVSRGFRASARKSRFLKFVVQETQAGHADRIKAFTIAMDVFDRDASFDPLLDPVVRIQAGRIRRCLEQYYLTEGASDPIQITIPKGGYVPHFVINKNAEDAGLANCPEHGKPAPIGKDSIPSPPMTDVPPKGLSSTLAARAAPILQASWTPALRPLGTPRGLALATVGLLTLCILFLSIWFFVAVPAPSKLDMRTATVRGPSLLVLPFANATGNPAQGIFAEGFTEDLIGALIRFKNVFVFGSDTTFHYRTEPELRRAESGVTLDYVLKGSIGQSGDQIQISVSLISAKDKRYIWSNSYRGGYNLSNMTDARQDIAVQVASALAQSNGVIDQQGGQASASRSPNEMSSYDCMLRTRQYRRQPSLELHAQVRTCLERATMLDPHYADAWAALAMVYVDEAQLGFNAVDSRPEPVSAGLVLAEHAVSLAPDNPLPHQAVGLAYWLLRDPAASIAAYEKAHELNPHDSDILADLGRSYSLTGDWEQGIPLLREAFLRNPAQPKWYRIVFALYHYVNGRYDEALAEAQRLEVRNLMLAHVALAMIYGQTGRNADATHKVEEILRLDPQYGDKAIAEFERRNIHPTIIAKIVDGLQKAGLSLSPQWAGTEGR